MGTKTFAVCAVVSCVTGSAAAQGRAMSLQEALARARDQSPAIISARLSEAEARGRLAGASVRLTSNPQLEGAIGNRDGQAARFTDFELGISQAFEPGARRSARLDGANAAIARSTAHTEEATRLVLRDVSLAYHRLAHAEARIRLLIGAQELATRLFTVAERRFQAGDIAVLDVNLSRAALARVKAEREGAEAAKALAAGELRQLLRLDDEVEISDALTHPPAADLSAALQSSSARPELRALEAGVQEAEAELRVGLSYSKPEYGFGARYSREEGDHIVLGGMTLTLPVFSKGQEQRASGSARATRLRTELEAARARIQTQVRTAHTAYNRRLAALTLLETDALPGLDENEQLTTRSFEVGQIGLPDLLLIRREILDTRFQHLDALLEAALARAELDAAAGVLR
jgi:cobalt-zinc-cadmium efflux system outer membrane protein